ncbi:MAG: hypothetical protein BGO43_13105 [Gammaproteobacteria bacterium 39-13]|nr:MAG: hypothetical protein BGO43_13105 [Gammaproteobacteria bacterium 39-13]
MLTTIAHAIEPKIDDKTISQASQLYAYVDKSFYSSESNPIKVLEVNTNSLNMHERNVRAPKLQSYNKFFQPRSNKAPYNFPYTPESDVPTMEHVLDKSLTRISE